MWLICCFLFVCMYRATNVPLWVRWLSKRSTRIARSSANRYLRWLRPIWWTWALPLSPTHWRIFAMKRYDWNFFTDFSIIICTRKNECQKLLIQIIWLKIWTRFTWFHTLLPAHGHLFCFVINVSLLRYWQITMFVKIFPADEISYSVCEHTTTEIMSTNIFTHWTLYIHFYTLNYKWHMHHTHIVTVSHLNNSLVLIIWCECFRPCFICTSYIL